MTKTEKAINNGSIETLWEDATIYLRDVENYSIKKLRSCTAEVIITDKYYFLRSYNTIVAFIDRNTDTLVDVLRLVYGYTSTSAQHISKFNSDYGSGKWGCAYSIRWLA